MSLPERPPVKPTLKVQPKAARLNLAPLLPWAALGLIGGGAYLALGWAGALLAVGGLMWLDFSLDQYLGGR